MAAQQVVELSTNAWVSFGAPIGGKLECTGSVGLSVENGAKAQPMTDGTVGVSSGISVGEVSLTLMAKKGSTQQRKLQKIRAGGTIVSIVINDGVAKYPFTGIVSAFSLTSEANDTVKFEYKMTGAPGDVQ